MVVGAGEVVGGVCDVISKGSFSGDAEAPYLTVGEGAASILARAHALGGGDDWVGSRVGIRRHFEGRGLIWLIVVEQRQRGSYIAFSLGIEQRRWSWRRQSLSKERKI